MDLKKIKKMQIIIVLIVLSFIAPSLHFIQHNHSYNPFINKLVHPNNIKSASNKIKIKSKYSEIESSDKVILNPEICKITLNNEVFQKNYYSPIIKTKIQNQYVYLFNILIKKVISNKVLFIAPKNSPPIA